MSTTTHADSPPRRSALERQTAMRLAATEYQRFGELLQSLTAVHWSTPTGCVPWDVRAMATHLLGMAEMAASIREQSRQVKAATRHGGVFIDALTSLQVEEHQHLRPDEIVRAYLKVGPKAARGRRRTPGFIRRRSMPQPQLVGDHEERWTIGYLVDVILTRDPWMHRIDIALATGAPNVLTAEHDGVIVDDLVSEWAARHAQPYALRLTGPAGGFWTTGAGGPALELEVTEFCLMISGRVPAEGLLATEVPF
ncbi:MAG: maleylpyruvate isomerase family mycothiol-dependent enzyme [Actinomycetota bacterium]|nr:maleylpyruvate isomerase family mycothiol-dependent enzyme [Actinomycetota bacterium]